MSSAVVSAAAPDPDVELGTIIKSVSRSPPTHYTVKIESFSTLVKRAGAKYESGIFQSGGYKWKLVLYPNGNMSKSATDHVSIYVAIIPDTTSMGLGWEVHAVFRCFLMDQKKDNYLFLEAKQRRFHGMRTEWGFDRFIPLTTFNDAQNGYLVEDTCVFGAEVFVHNERITTGRGESLSMIKEPVSTKHTWRIENFSKLDSEFKESLILYSGDEKWKIQIYPRGQGYGKGSHVSLYLVLGEYSSSSKTKICAEFSLRMLDQSRRDRPSDIVGRATHWFSESSRECGWSRFVSFEYFNTHLLVRDTAVVEAEITVLGIVKSL